MSPEQARGRPLDKRTDVWAFGCVLYEMLTGQLAFGGDNVTDILAGVVGREPDWGKLPSGTPRVVHRLLRLCLEKDPTRRLRDIGDAWIATEEQPPPATVSEPRPLGSGRGRWIPWALLTLVTVAAGITVWLQHRAPPVARAVRFAVHAPEKTVFGSTAPHNIPAISPDGRRLAFVATSEGRSMLWVRPLDSLTAQVLPGTEGATYPFWSPDSRFIGFFANPKLKKIDISGGPPQTLCDVGAHWGGAWNRDGIIVFAPNTRPLQRVSAAGGVPAEVTAFDTSRQEVGHAYPWFLPDGRRFLFTSRSSQREKSGVYVGSLDSRTAPKRILAGETMAVYAPPASGGQGHLLFLREGVLMAQVFDTSRLELAGEPFRAAEAARFLSASSNGALAYFGWSFGAASRLAWFDREGKQLSTAGQPGPYRDLSLAPDDQRVAVAVRADDSAGSSAINTDLWLLDLVRGIPTRFTFDPGLDYRALWAPDGSRIVFSSNRDGPYNLYQKVSSGAGEEEALLKSGESKIACDWSADGRVILYISRDQKTGLDLWVLPLGASSGPERKPSPFQRTQFNEVQGQFSPDGRWVAYSSDESGKYEVYVRPFGAPSGPSGGGKWQVSTRGASHPRWRRDGKELFFLSADGKLMAVPVKAGATFEPGLARELFPTRIRLGGAETVTYRYAVAADGKRFLIAVPEEEAASTPITVVLNWAAGVQE